MLKFLFILILISFIMNNENNKIMLMSYFVEVIDRVLKYSSKTYNDIMNSFFVEFAIFMFWDTLRASYLIVKWSLLAILYTFLFFNALFWGVMEYLGYYDVLQLYGKMFLKVYIECCEVIAVKYFDGITAVLSGIIFIFKSIRDMIKPYWKFLYKNFQENIWVPIVETYKYYKAINEENKKKKKD